jgi:phage anti-repressor protein
MSVDIVSLIENNPITKLNGNYHSKVVEKIKKDFSNYEQQLFVASFYCYLKYDKNDFVVDLDNIWNWLGFTQKVTSTNLLKKHFEIDKDYKLLTCVEKPQNTRGGHNKETYLLTIKTFKLFCIKAGTKKASELHEYFIKLEEILHETLQEETNELQLQLTELRTKQKEEYEDKLKIQSFLEKEKILLREFANIGSIFYIIKVKTLENGQYIIKIGESRKGIENRYKEHKHNYEECLLLDCFLVNKSKDFETFIKEHESIRLNRVNDLPKHETELELFLIGKNLSYQTLINIINNNIKYFNYNDTSKLELENANLKLMLEMNNSSNDNLFKKELIQLTLKIDSLEKTCNLILEKLNTSHTKVATNFGTPLVTLGPRLQKINPDTMTLVKVYESVSECINETNFVLKRPSLNKAVVENTVYNGFRWQFVERDKDPNIIENIQPTKKTRPQNLGYIAKLNNEKTEILNVYIDRKTAAVQNGFGIAALDAPVKNGTPHKGHYYILYDYCDTSLQQDFENAHGTPLLYRDGVGQYNKENELVRIFNCKYDCIKQLKMSDKTLTKSLDKNILYNDHFFRKIGDKLSCL